MSNRNKKLLLEAAAYREEINQKTQKNFNRRVTFVTNVAESSITLEGYTYVIDNGYALVDSYDPLHLASQLKLERISRAQQIQRRGRVGRVGPGVAYYLYTKKEADKFAAFPLAQIARADLSESILNFLVLPDINTIDELGVLLSELIEPPPLAAVEAALLQLRALGWTNEDFIPFQAKKLTDLKGTFSERGQFGIRTFQASTPAPTAEALISSWENHCANEVCGIFALIDATRGGDLGKLVDPQSKFTQDAAQEKARKKYSAKEGLLTTLLIFGRPIAEKMERIGARARLIIIVNESGSRQPGLTRRLSGKRSRRTDGCVSRQWGNYRRRCVHRRIRRRV